MLFSLLFKWVDNILSTFSTALVKGYRLLISPLFGSTCRFSPTCSQYALDAFATHPFYRAIKMIISRIFRCHPFSTGGYDPVKKANG
jgi:hypothetical protein